VAEGDETLPHAFQRGLADSEVMCDLPGLIEKGRNGFKPGAHAIGTQAVAFDRAHHRCLFACESKPERQIS
jgi:hypothetical protein